MKTVRLAFILILLATGCTTAARLPVTEDLLVNEDERMLWRRSIEEQKALDASGILYRDRELEDYLNLIARKLQPADLSADLSFKVLVVKDPYLNAFAFPNGTIYVHTGILARMDNEAQLAALLAHEMSHCTHRHALRAFRMVKDRPAFIASVQQTLAGLAMVQELARFLGLTGSMAAVTGYSRELETEADRAGLDLLFKADYDSEEALHLFAHLKEEIENEGIKEPYLFGTHPKVQERIDNIDRLRETKGAVQKGGLRNTAIFLSKVSNVILENARLDLRIGRYTLARKGVEKYLRIRKDDAHAYYLMGEIFRQRDQADDIKIAIGYYEKAISTDPSYADPLKAVGLIHYKAGHKLLAKKFFESCLALAPDAPDKAYIQGYIQKCIGDGEG
jgi:predicted Zn-dependent protease